MRLVFDEHRSRSLSSIFSKNIAQSAGCWQNARFPSANFKRDETTVKSDMVSRICVSVPMTEPLRPRVKYVIGPDGSPLTIADLPPPGTQRWVIRRKAEVVAAVRGGLLSLEEACSRYTLTTEEFLSWQMSIDRHGLAGLRTTRIQHYRQ
jgi:hypothetical protein